MYKLIIFFCISFTLFAFFISAGSGTITTGHHNIFKTGSEVLIDNSDFLLNKNVAVISNKSGITKNGEHLVSGLLKKGVKIKKIFTPEHGFASDDKYSKEFLGIEIISLYGEKKSFVDGDLKDIDIVIYDIQDLSVRFYTYASTLFLTLQYTIENNKEYIICDRPIISRGDYVSGFMLNPEYSSFVGMVPTTVYYGMTSGELGQLLFNEAMDTKDNNLLKVIKMEGYNRNINYNDLNIPWVNTSPSIVNVDCARIYPALCFLEGTNISEGRGTEYPFSVFGAPFINSDILLEEINSYGFRGVTFEVTEFTPESSGIAYSPKFLNRKCYGIKICITNLKEFQPFELSIAILLSLKKTTPEFKWTGKNFIDKLAGTHLLRKYIDSKLDIADICNEISNDVEIFKEKRNKYLLY